MREGALAFAGAISVDQASKESVERRREGQLSFSCVIGGEFEKAPILNLAFSAADAFF